METAKIPHIEPEQMKNIMLVQAGDYVLRRGVHKWSYVQVEHTTKTQITVAGQKYMRKTGRAVGDEYGPTIQSVRKSVYEEDLKREALKPLSDRVRVAIYAAHSLYAHQQHSKIDPIDFAFEVEDLDKKIDQLEALIKELVIDVPERIQERYRQRNASR